MQNAGYFKKLFVVGALWNWGAAIFFSGISIFYQPLLPYFLNEIPENMLWFHLFLGLAFVFGLGYYWIGQETERNRDIIKMGIIGKAFVFCMLLYAWITGLVTVLVFLAGIVDLLFAILFTGVLMKLRR